MKKLVFFFLALFLLNFNLYSQFKQKQVELTASAGIGSESFKSTYGNSSNSDSHSYIMLSVIPGIFVTDGFSIEPEIGMTAVESAQPAYLLLLNVSYTYLIPKSTIAPFGRIGYGVANGIGFPNQFIMGNVSSSLDLNVFNIGAGIKHLIGQSAVLRLELNYRSFSQNKNSVTQTQSFISVLFGFGVIL